jgi:cell division septation protein DedD
LRASNPGFDLAAKIKSGSDKPVMRIAKAIPAIPQPPAIKKLEGYTIQLASYQNKGSAVKEAERLKKNGLTALVVAKGNYSILCVGSFNSKETAGPLLSQLKRKYQDSFIRRL